MTRNRTLPFLAAAALVPLLGWLGACSSGDDGGSTCDLASTWPWDFDLTTATGGLSAMNGTLTQSGCVVTFNKGAVTLSGSLGQDTGSGATWNASVTQGNAQTGNFVGTFSRSAPGQDYDLFAVLSGELGGEAITGGGGDFTGGGTPSDCPVTTGPWDFEFSVDDTSMLLISSGDLTRSGDLTDFDGDDAVGVTYVITGDVDDTCAWDAEVFVTDGVENYRRGALARSIHEPFRQSS